MRKSKITKYTEYSLFSGKEATCMHHCIFGKGLHNLADEDGLTIPLTDNEHNMSNKGTINQIHENPAAEKLSKMLGQAIWERNHLIKQLALPFESEDETFDRVSDECRAAFMKRYGRSYL